MIILDTNVVSETLRPQPDVTVLQWLTSQPSSAIFTTTITRGEILYGVQLLPAGRRRSALRAAITAIFTEDLAGHILPFDNDAADAYADIAAARKAEGHPISQSDAMIAAVTRSRGARLATRNTKDFTNCHLELINPWETGGA